MNVKDNEIALNWQAISSILFYSVHPQTAIILSCDNKGERLFIIHVSISDHTAIFNF